MLSDQPMIPRALDTEQASRSRQDSSTIRMIRPRFSEHAHPIPAHRCTHTCIQTRNHVHTKKISLILFKKEIKFFFFCGCDCFPPSEPVSTPSPLPANHWPHFRVHLKKHVSSTAMLTYLQRKPTFAVSSLQEETIHRLFSVVCLHRH